MTPYLTTERVALKAPFPYFGGKSSVADLVWPRFGDVPNYVEPFAGSLAVLLSRPHDPQTETVNDLDGMISNFWRAVRFQPEATAEAADWPVSEPDLHARHLWLVEHREDLTAHLMGDPDWCDPKVAGWWVWGICSWIGSGWCSGKGPWVAEDGRLVLGTRGQGINRQLPHLGDRGQGINRQLPHLGDRGRGILDTFLALQERLRDVRVCCGDWTRVLGESPTIKLGTTAIFLDPPYDQDERCSTLYAVETSVSAAVREWALEHGDDRRYRIALCGYDGEHTMPGTWEEVAWKARGGFGSQGDDDGEGRKNSGRERIWFSPGCLRVDRQLGLFGGTP